MTDVADTLGIFVPAGATHVVRWPDGPSWDRFVSAAADGTLAHRWAWREVVTGTYGHPYIALAAVRGPALVGVLPLVLVRSRVFGRRLVSMPYLDYGGVVTGGDRDAERVLVSAAVALAGQHHAELELRHLYPKDADLPCATEKVTLTLDLTGGEDAAWRRVRPNRRSQVRKATRLGLRASVLGPEGLDGFYRVWSANMRDLGSPVHPRSFFARLLDGLGGDADVLLVEDAGRPVGAAIVLRHGDRAVMPWSSSLRESLPKGPNQLLYWEAVRHAVATGATTFDFGRSSVGSGTYDAKREWGADAVQLYWHGQVGDDSDRLARMQWATRVWRHLPVPVTVAVGSRVRGGITR